MNPTPKLKHTESSIIEAFNEINSGEISNTHFLGANVVMLSKFEYDKLVNQIESLKDELEKATSSKNKSLRTMNSRQFLRNE